MVQKFDVFLRIFWNFSWHFRRIKECVELLAHSFMVVLWSSRNQACRSLFVIPVDSVIGLIQTFRCTLCSLWDYSPEMDCNMRGHHRVCMFNAIIVQLKQKLYTFKHRSVFSAGFCEAMLQKIDSRSSSEFCHKLLMINNTQPFFTPVYQRVWDGFCSVVKKFQDPKSNLTSETHSGYCSHYQGFAN